MKYILCYSICLLFGVQQLTAQMVSIKSPDNKIVLNIKSDNGQLLFNVKRGETTVLEDSPMVFSSGDKKFSAIHLHSPEYYKVDETYPIRGIHSLAVNKANGMKVKIADKKNNTLYTVDARAYDDGIAFRFLVKGTQADKYIPRESTIFKLPLGSQIYYHDMYAHYEGIHKKQEIDCISKGEWAAPPVTIELPQKQGYACITESALRNYPGMSLQADGECGLVVRLGHEQPAGYPFAHDYTPMIFGERKLDTSWVHQIATALIFNSSVIFFGAHPQTILDNPAVDIIKDIPAVWDETIVLPCSEIGKIAAFARRSGDTWFLAVVNGKEAQTIQFPLSFLGEGWYEATILNDRPTDAGGIKIERAFCRNSDSLTGYMRNGGGYIVRFKSK